MTREEILKDTIEFYSADPINRRAIDENTKLCVYTTEDGCHCAVGRYLKPEYQTEDWLYNNDTSSDDLKLNVVLKDDIPEDIKKDYWFWKKLQELHDNNDFWDKNGLTDQGLIFVINIKTEIKQSNGSI